MNTDQPKNSTIRTLEPASTQPYEATPATAIAISADESGGTYEVTRDDLRRTKKHLIAELERLRARVAEYEANAQTQERDDRQRAYSYLSAHLAFTDAVLDSLDQGVITIDHNSHVTLMNRAARDMLGWGTGESLGKPIHTLIHCDNPPQAHTHPEHPEHPEHSEHSERAKDDGLNAFYARHDEQACPFTDSRNWRQVPEIPRWPVLSASHRSGVIRREHDIFTRKDGSHIPVAYSISPITWHKEITGLAIAFEDISEQQRIEQELRESDSRFQATFEAAAAGIALVALDGRFIQMNQRFSEMMGYPQEELFQRTAQSLIFDQDIAAATEVAHRLLNSEQSHIASEKRYIRKDGTLLWVYGSVSLVRSPAGEPRYFISVIEDITDRKQLEAELHTSRQQAADRATQLETVFEAIADGVIVLDGQGRLQHTNAAAQRVLTLMTNGHESPVLDFAQWQAATLRNERGQPFTKNQLPTARIVHGDVLTGANAMEAQLQTQDGRTLHYNISGAPLHDCTGAMSGIVLMLRDVTDRRRLERETQVRTHQLEATLEAMSDGVLVYDASGTIIHMNRAARRIYGIDAQPDFSGLTVEERVSRLHLRDDQGRAYHKGPEILRNILAGNALNDDQAIHLTMTTLDGRFARIQITGMPIHDEQRAINGAVLVVRDVTEQAQLQSRLHQMEHAIQEHPVQSETSDEFLTLASQSLEAPLANVHRALRRLALHTEHYLRTQRRQAATANSSSSASDGAKLRKYLHQALREAEQFERTFNELLDVSRIRSRQLTLHLAPCDLLAITRQVVKRLQTAHPMRDIRLVPPANRSRLPVLADSARVAQALTRYLRDALQSAPADRPITITLNGESDAQGRWARVAVQDERQAATTDQRFGFDLSICRALIEWQRGQVGMESALETGATFWFALPLISG
jgi:PAS domain S-box-containing protein